MASYYHHCHRLEEQENMVLGELQVALQRKGDEMARLNAMNRKLKDMVAAGQSIGGQVESQANKKLQVDALELRRVNKELQHQKRDLNVKIAAAQAQVATLVSKNEMVEAELAALRPANQDLSRQVEALQNNRFSEVEELVYLRWVNACLRYELRNMVADGNSDGKATELSKHLSPKSQEKAKQLMLEYAGPELLALTSSKRFETGYDDSASSSQTTTSSDCGDLDGFSELSCRHRHGAKKLNLIHKLKNTWKRRSKLDYDSEAEMLHDNNHSSELTATKESSESKLTDQKSSSSTSNFNSIAASFQIMSRSVHGGEMTHKYPTFKDRHKIASERIKQKAQEMAARKRSDLVATMSPAEIEQRSVRKPESPPAVSSTDHTISTSSRQVPPPPPPPPPPLPLISASPGKLKGSATSTMTSSKVQRAPEVIEFYHTMMKRDCKTDAMRGTAASSSSNLADARNSMIGEIENRSSHLLAIKADVETQGQFVESVASAVRAARYSNMEDVVAFVNWLDDELSFLVDERAVLKHFDWPEAKADALRESAFDYQDLKKLEQQVASFQDDTKTRRDAALRKMQSLLERIEHSIYGFLRTRDLTASRYNEFNIPTYWMLDSGLIGKVKQSSVRLAEQFMKRVVSELGGAENEVVKEFLLLQGVRFAFRVHQFAGGFDKESMRAFEELRSCSSTGM